jgi:hypothetical protein
MRRAPTPSRNTRLPCAQQCEDHSKLCGDAYSQAEVEDEGERTRAASVSVSVQELEDEVVQRFLRGNATPFKDCYQSYLSTKKTEAGQGANSDGKVTEAEELGVYLYTHEYPNLYRPLNEEMRQGKFDSQKTACTLRNAICHMSSPGEGQELYRGQKKLFVSDGECMLGDWMFWSCFTSTSTSLDVAWAFSSCDIQREGPPRQQWSVHPSHVEVSE